MGDNKISEAARFTKRPVTIEAMQFDGSAKSASAICQWANAGDDAAGHDEPTVSYTITDGDDAAHDMVIWTLEGDMAASAGDWIIKGVKGEFYPCKPDIFELTYSPHLQGEEVPVAYIVPSARVCHDGSMEDGPDSLCFAGEADDYVKRVGEPLFTHPQPAELSEVSGGSGELGGAIERLGRYAYIAEQSGEQQACRDIRKVLAALAATGKQQVGEAHPDDQAVGAFAVAMKEKMAAARAKGRCGWEDPAQCSADDLSRMLRDHVDKGDPRDVANFCMMLHQRGEAIASREPAGQERVAWASTGATGHKVVAMPGLHKLPYGDYDLYAAPPAQGIDLGQFRGWLCTTPDGAAADWTTMEESRARFERLGRTIEPVFAAGRLGQSTRTDHLLDRRNRLMNSYGNGDREDAAIDAQIAQVDAELALLDGRDAGAGVGQ